MQANDRAPQDFSHRADGGSGVVEDDVPAEEASSAAGREEGFE